MIGDEDLIRYLDGELEPGSRAAVETARAADGALNERLERLRRSGDQVRRAFDPILEEPAPERLTTAVYGGRVLAIPRRARPPSARFWWGGAAVAASVLLGVLIGRISAASLIGPDLSTRGALSTALDRQPSGRTAGPVRVALSFRAIDGSYCRVFSLVQAGAAGLACRTEGGWRVRLMAPETRGGTAAYRMAGGDLPAPVAALAQSLAGGPALNPDQERAATTNKWR